VSNNRLVLEGLAEFRAALRALPAELVVEAGPIVEGAANGAAAAIVAAYPERTGRLRKGVSVKRVSEGGLYGVGAVVVNRAPHAALFDSGTQTRQTAIGANRGRMPPGNVFVPRIIQARRQMYARLKDLLARQGFVVSGDA